MPARKTTGIVVRANMTATLPLRWRSMRRAASRNIVLSIISPGDRWSVGQVRLDALYRRVEQRGHRGGNVAAVADREVETGGGAILQVGADAALERGDALVIKGANLQ